MRKLFLPFIWIFVVVGCTTNDFNNSNPYIPNYSFSVTINTSLPAYSNLQYAANAIIYYGAGAKGVIVFNTGSGYRAYDAACPNMALASCTAMSINGINAVCSCDESEYSLFTGQGSLEYPLKAYQVSVSGTVITVYN
jgi:nitrite reductase/ring-hydroxylating ferredoxin subunit